ncbi:MAG: HupE/UreJ family protein [Flavobacteriaceae bacterium]|nr:HupE/UreJ family protein [Flavobacteriaceae bacterium]
MNQFLDYFNLGLNHVLDLQGYDHILFFIVMVVAHSFKDFKKTLIVVSLFTLGHSLSLIAASYKLISVNSSLVEFLIPLTILITAAFNILSSNKLDRLKANGFTYFTAISFGLIHGLGFSTYFKMIVGKYEDKMLPLLEFALGIEVAQIIVVILILTLAFILQDILRFKKRDWVLVMSSIVIGVVLPMLIERYPW